MAEFSSQTQSILVICVVSVYHVVCRNERLLEKVDINLFRKTEYQARSCMIKMKHSTEDHGKEYNKSQQYLGSDSSVGDDSVPNCSLFV